MKIGKPATAVPPQPAPPTEEAHPNNNAAANSADTPPPPPPSPTVAKPPELPPVRPRPTTPARPPFRPIRSVTNEKDKEVDELIKTIGESTHAQLRQIAIDRGMTADEIPIRRDHIVLALLQRFAEHATRPRGAGILDINQEGFGFLRPTEQNADMQDVHVSRSTVAANRLRAGDIIVGLLQPPRGNTKLYALQRPELINGYSPARLQNRLRFEKLQPQYPETQIKLEQGRYPVSARIVDLIAPIGRGQRALIVAPPKAGKTIILKEIANSIHVNHPELELIITLIGERPEEVTDMRKTSHAEMYSSTFDESADRQCRVAERSLERARRIVEMGGNVVILLDSLTRLARAYNAVTPSSGKTLSGGMDPSALYPPKKFFGAARNCSANGSLTIIATTLIDTGSRLDELIYEEFKGTGNMELHLDRSMADRRIFPAIDIIKSGTRHEELLLDNNTLQTVWKLRRWVAIINEDSKKSHDSTEGAERIVQQIKQTESNAEFLQNLNRPKQ